MFSPHKIHKMKLDRENTYVIQSSGVSSPLCLVNNTMHIIMCVFTYMQSKTQQFVKYYHYVISCILRSFAYYIVILSDKLLCFWLHVYVNTHIILYIVLHMLYSCWSIFSFRNTENISIKFIIERKQKTCRLHSLLMYNIWTQPRWQNTQFEFHSSQKWLILHLQIFGLGVQHE